MLCFRSAFSHLACANDASTEICTKFHCVCGCVCVSSIQVILQLFAVYKSIIVCVCVCATRTQASDVEKKNALFIVQTQSNIAASIRRNHSTKKPRTLTQTFNQFL